MKKAHKAAILIKLVEEMRKKGSWCGETHIQKAVYFLQELLKVPLDLDYVLYKHGPYSFDLTDVLSSMRADSLLSLEPQPPYGPRVIPSEAGESLKERFPKTLRKYRKQTCFVAKKFNKKNVGKLEQLATALYVHLEFGSFGKVKVKTRAAKIHKLKRHISSTQATEAVKWVDKLVEDSKALALS